MRIRLDEFYLFFSSFAILCFIFFPLLNLQESITVASILPSVDPSILPTGMYLIFSILLFFYDFKWSNTCSFALNIVVNISFILLMQVVIASALYCPCSFASALMLTNLLLIFFTVLFKLILVVPVRLLLLLLLLMLKLNHNLRLSPC